MAKLGKDEAKQLSDPIIIEAGVLGDKEYCLEKITMDMTEQLASLANEPEKNFRTLAKQLGIIFSVDPQEFYGVDLRVLVKVTKWVTNEIEKEIDGKNG